MIPLSPIMQRHEKSFIQELCQRSSPVMPNFQGLWTNVSHQRWQVRLKVITSALLKLFDKIAGPILAIHLQAVAKDSIRRRVGAKRLHQTVTDILQIALCGRTIK